MSDQSPGNTVERHRERIVEAAFALLTQEGRDAVSTRTVSAAAGVQAPVIYRLFGDKNGLLDAVAAYGFAAHLTAEEGRKVLREYIHRVAEAGRLRVREDLATLMVHTAGCGTALGLLAQPAEQRDLALSTANREALIAAITTDQQHDTGPVEPATAAVTRAGDARNDHHARGRRGEGTAGIPGGVTAGGEFGRLSPPRRRLPA